jgi:hypothetical protein
MTALLRNFVVTALTTRPSLATRNLVRLFADQDYRGIAIGEAGKGYNAGRDDALERWKSVFDDAIDQLLIVGANALDDPGAFIVGVSSTAIQLGGQNPLADSSPATHRQLNEWISEARKKMWAGVVPPPPPEIPEDDLATAKADFMVAILSAVLPALLDPPAAAFTMLSLPDIIETYQRWEQAEDQATRNLVGTLLGSMCEPDTLGFSLAYLHGAADINTSFMVGLRFSEWQPLDTF